MGFFAALNNEESMATIQASSSDTTSGTYAVEGSDNLRSSLLDCLGTARLAWPSHRPKSCFTSNLQHLTLPLRSVPTITDLLFDAGKFSERIQDLGVRIQPGGIVQKMLTKCERVFSFNSGELIHGGSVWPSSTESRQRVRQLCSTLN